MPKQIKAGPMTEKEYVANGGVLCPFCRSENITATEQIQGDDGIATGGVKCLDCGSTWTAYYHLIGLTQTKKEGKNVYM